jgi:hypothetical protein
MDKIELLKDARLTSALLELRGYLALNPSAEEIFSALRRILRTGASALRTSENALKSVTTDSILSPGMIESFKIFVTEIFEPQDRSEGNTK